MNGFEDWLQMDEMPLKALNLVPPHDPTNPKSAWSPDAKRKHGWDRADAKLLTNPNAVEKFTRLWGNSEHDFYFYVVRSKEARKFQQVGEVSTEWVRANLPQMADYKPEEDGINVIFVNNTGDQKIPFTAWTAAHRFGHALNGIGKTKQPEWEYFTDGVQSRLEKILNNHYQTKPERNMHGSSFPDRKTSNYLQKIATEIGTMKSARQKTLRNFYEFNYELLAQYLVTQNKVQFQKDLKNNLVTRFAWGRPSEYKTKSKDSAENELADFAEWCNDALYQVMEGAVGNTYVM